MDNILFIGAAISFGLSAAGIGGRVNWVSLGFCLITLALWVL